MEIKFLKILNIRLKFAKVIHNFSWLLIDKFFKLAIGVSVGIWIARNLGAESFGLVNYASAFLGIFSAITGLGLQSIVVRDLIANPNGKFETLGTALVLQIIAGLICYLSLVLIISYIHPSDEITKFYVIISGSILLFKFSDVFIYWFESQLLSKYVVIIQNFSLLIFAGFKFYIIREKLPFFYFAWVTVLEILFISVALIWALEKKQLSIYNFKITSLRCYELISECWPLLFSNMAILIYMRLDQIMIGHLVGNEEVGIYSAATRVGELFYFIPMIFMSSIFPSVIKTRNTNKELYFLNFQRIYSFLIFISLIIILLISIFSSDIILLLFGDSFKESSVVLSIHILSSPFVFLGVASGHYFIIENKLLLGFYRTLIGLIINLSINFILIPNYGATGAAVATLISQAFAAWLFDFFQPSTKEMFKMKTNAFLLKGLNYKFLKNIL